MESPFSTGEEAMLEHAIRLSLEKESSPTPIGIDGGKGKGKVKGKGTRDNAIVISDDEDVSISIGGTGKFSGSKAPGIPGLDRAAMERERLARRAQSTSPHPGSIKAKRERARTAAAAAPLRSAVEMDLPYRGGVVHKTQVSARDRTADTISIEEVLGVRTLYSAVLSAFQWDFNWIFNKLPSGRMENMVLVLQAKTKEEKDHYTRAFTRFGGKSRVVFPDMEECNTMHSKLMVLFHRRPESGDSWMRIVVPTANLTSHDWGEGRTLENMVFVIDLPRYTTPTTPKSPKTQFGRELFRFVRAQGWPKDVVDSMKLYDYSSTSELAFVHSIGGSHYDEDIIEHTGYPGLATAIKDLGYAVPAKTGATVDFVTSSLGATDHEFLMSLYNTALGCNGFPALKRKPPPAVNKRRLRQRKSALPPSPLPTDTLSPEEAALVGEEEREWSVVRDRFRVYFPSQVTVKKSLGGYDGAGTIFFVKAQWEDQGYPREVVRDCKSVREGLVMHVKVMYVVPREPVLVGEKRLEGWAYVGSANMSEAAWGKLQFNRALAKPLVKIKCKNWECGVVVPVWAKSEGQRLGGPISTSEAFPEQSSSSTIRAEPITESEFESESESSSEPESSSEFETSPLQKSKKSKNAPSTLPNDTTNHLALFSPTIPVPMKLPAEPLTLKSRPPWFQADIFYQRKREAKTEKKREKRLKRVAADSDLEEEMAVSSDREKERRKMLELREVKKEERVAKWEKEKREREKWEKEKREKEKRAWGARGKW